MSLKYRPEIDGLRALAVLPVILFHAGLNFFKGGYVGVDIFFVISGYLIGYIILDKIEIGKFSIFEFYENRARRILPALFVVMTSCIVMAWYWMDPAQWQEFSNSLPWVSFFGSNFFFMEQSDYFAQASELKPLLHTWSLAVEEQYYLIFPILMMGLFRFGRKFLFGFLASIGLMSLLLCIFLAYRYPSESFFMLPSRMWELLFGAACAFILFYKKAPLGPNKLFENILSLIGMGMILYSIIGFNRETVFPSILTLVPVLGTVLIILFATSNTWVKKILSFQPFVWIGLISYSAYLWHQPLFAFARIRASEVPSDSLLMALSSLSLILAYFTWKFVEQPFRKKRYAQGVYTQPKMLNRTGVFFLSIFGLCLFGCLGFAQSKGTLKPNRLNLYVDIDKTLKEATASRLDGIRFGKCDFYPTIGWQEKWACESGQGMDSELDQTKIAIVGDSHGSDKAMMLRQIGYSPTSFASSGCPLTPKLERPIVEEKDRFKVSLLTTSCFELSEFAKREIQSNENIKEIWLSNSFDANKLDVANIQSALEYWSLPGKQLVFFSHIPTFPELSRKLLKLPNGEPLPYYPVNFELYQYSSRPELQALFRKYNVVFVDMREVACGSSKCDYKNEAGEILYTDGEHLSAIGAKFMGENLLDLYGCNEVTPELTRISHETSRCD